MNEDPKAVIERLLSSGMTQLEIADALKEEGIEVTQATINRIKTGAIRRTGFDIGRGLLKLHEKRLQASSIS